MDSLDTRGIHIIAELSGCEAEKLADLESVKQAMVQAANKAGAVVCDVAFHRFSPQGVSGVVVIAESHLSIHTWPELGYAAVDLYTCGAHTNPYLACQYLAEFFGAGSVSQAEIERGIPLAGNTFGHQVAKGTMSIKQ